MTCIFKFYQQKIVYLELLKWPWILSDPKQNMRGTDVQWNPHKDIKRRRKSLVKYSTLKLCYAWDFQNAHGLHSVIHQIRCQVIIPILQTEQAGSREWAFVYKSAEAGKSSLT